MALENEAKHEKIMRDNILFFYAEDAVHKGVDASELGMLTDGCSKSLVETSNPAYRNPSWRIRGPTPFGSGW
jgi:hypothetical protein